MLSFSVLDLPCLIHLCERELVWLDLINRNLAVYALDHVARCNVDVLV